mmetsp:Transcript_43403/g.86232  ORF Transcript_43403/g.86232 Transcript_43403/m.86232 type:complete len:264 (-) Transcript_43403:166-957(-)
MFAQTKNPNGEGDAPVTPTTCEERGAGAQAVRQKVSSPLHLASAAWTKLRRKLEWVPRRRLLLLRSAIPRCAWASCHGEAVFARPQRLPIAPDLVHRAALHFLPPCLASPWRCADACMRTGTRRRCRGAVCNHLIRAGRLVRGQRTSTGGGPSGGRHRIHEHCIPDGRVAGGAWAPAASLVAAGDRQAPCANNVGGNHTAPNRGAAHPRRRWRRQPPVWLRLLLGAEPLEVGLQKGGFGLRQRQPPALPPGHGQRCDPVAEGG